MMKRVVPYFDGCEVREVAVEVPDGVRKECPDTPCGRARSTMYFEMRHGVSRGGCQSSFERRKPVVHQVEMPFVERRFLKSVVRAGEAAQRKLKDGKAERGKAEMLKTENLKTEIWKADGVRA